LSCSISSQWPPRLIATTFSNLVKSRYEFHASEYIVYQLCNYSIVISRWCLGWL
jgi:hypothetical protein